MNDGLRHTLSCSSNWPAEIWDGSCLRCAKIKLVIYLRRKTQTNGASSGEETVALAKADAIRTQFQLTRGEIFDRQFETVPTITEVKAGAFKQTSAARGKSRVRPTAAQAFAEGALG